MGERSKSNSYLCILTHQVIMSIEVDDLREEKLKQLNSLVGALSFPPPPSGKPSNFNIWYVITCMYHVCNMTTISTVACFDTAHKHHRYSVFGSHTY